ncbi:hypothetical protein TRAPUB_459 [Trametes pubescens]|uniref:Uncharacterized protein n=1 Tax=Trametes pubescens TaxID=154538 RepID=A0A1M2VM50_TRAPU|nr:hypothetical protein TRAPUB_459 [Trametes pubescens]
MQTLQTRWNEVFQVLQTRLSKAERGISTLNAKGSQYKEHLEQLTAQLGPTQELASLINARSAEMAEREELVQQTLQEIRHVLEAVRGQNTEDVASDIAPTCTRPLEDNRPLPSLAQEVSATLIFPDPSGLGAARPAPIRGGDGWWDVQERTAKAHQSPRKLSAQSTGCSSQERAVPEVEVSEGIPPLEVQVANPNNAGVNQVPVDPDTTTSSGTVLAMAAKELCTCSKCKRRICNEGGIERNGRLLNPGTILEHRLDNALKAMQRDEQIVGNTVLLATVASPPSSQSTLPVRASDNVVSLQSYTDAVGRWLERTVSWIPRVSLHTLTRNQLS